MMSKGYEFKILSEVLDKNDRVMEIDAAIGFLSAYCAKKIGNDKVVAYEANPQMIGKIKETYKLSNVNPIINNVIFLDKDSELIFIWSTIFGQVLQ